MDVIGPGVVDVVAFDVAFGRAVEKHADGRRAADVAADDLDQRRVIGGDLVVLEGVEARGRVGAQGEAEEPAARVAAAQDRLAPPLAGDALEQLGLAIGRPELHVRLGHDQEVRLLERRRFGQVDDAARGRKRGHRRLERGEIIGDTVTDGAVVLGIDDRHDGQRRPGAGRRARGARLSAAAGSGAAACTCAATCSGAAARTCAAATCSGAAARTCAAAGSGAAATSRTAGAARATTRARDARAGARPSGAARARDAGAGATARSGATARAGRHDAALPPRPPAPGPPLDPEHPTATARTMAGNTFIAAHDHFTAEGGAAGHSVW